MTRNSAIIGLWDGPNGDGRSPSGSGSRPSGRAADGVSPVPASIPSAGALKVWWIPQVPMAPFEAAVPDLATAAAILDVLADYDAFQFRTNIKGDYSNAGGLMVLRDDGGWEDWEDPDTCDDFDQWRDDNLPKIMTNGWRERDLTASAIEAETPGKGRQ